VVDKAEHQTPTDQLVVLAVVQVLHKEQHEAVEQETKVHILQSKVMQVVQQHQQTNQLYLLLVAVEQEQ
jgi:hypothetical protein